MQFRINRSTRRGGHHVHEHDPSALLVRMANDIGNFFHGEPVREDAITGIANHIAKFWTKRMRERLAAHGDAGLDELPCEAMRRLRTWEPSGPEPPGGDAG
jgi:formate dehydrogenase subunit delta